MSKKLFSIILSLVFAVSICVALGAFVAPQAVNAAGGKKILDNDHLTKKEKCADATITFSDGGATMKVENVGGNYYSHYVGFQIEDMSGKDTVTFTFTTLSSGTFNGLVFFQPNYSEMYGSVDIYNITEATNATIASVDGKENKGASISVANGTPKTITVKFGSAMNDNGQLRIAITDHYNADLSYQISDISFGEAQEEPAVESDFVMVGARIRLDDYAGVRFEATLKKTAFSATAEYGMAIMPLDVLKTYNIDVTSFDSDADYIQLIEDNAAEYLNARKANNPDFAYTMKADPEIKNESDDHYVIRGTISEILYNNLGRKFFGIAYCYDNGKYSYAEFSDDFSRSVVGIAKTVYDDYAADSNERAILDGFISKNECKKAGITEDQYKAGGFITLTAGEDMELTVGAGATLSPVAKISGNAIDAAFTFESDDTSVATVSEDGKITAVKEGEANVTVTATYYGKSVNTVVKVTVNAAPVATSETIMNVGKWELDNADFTLENNNTQLTVSGIDKGNGNGQVVYFGLANLAGKSSMSFTIKNNHSKAVKIKLWISVGLATNHYSDAAVNITSATNGTANNNDGGRNGVLIELAAGEAKNVTVGFSGPVPTERYGNPITCDIGINGITGDENQGALRGGYTISNITFG